MLRATGKNHCKSSIFQDLDKISLIKKTTEKYVVFFQLGLGKINPVTVGVAIPINLNATVSAEGA